MKNEIARVRDWLATQIRSGKVPDESWSRHVRLIEAIDDVLHDISVAETASRTGRHAGGALRLVDRENFHVETGSRSDGWTRRKTGSQH